MFINQRTKYKYIVVEKYTGSYSSLGTRNVTPGIDQHNTIFKPLIVPVKMA